MTDVHTIIEDYAERTRYVNRVDVLDKVKALELLPDDVHATVDMVASYYEAAPEAIRSLVKDNRVELGSDGYRVLAGEELRSLKDLSSIAPTVPSLAVFPRRAILRVGMLLRDSVVAKNVRTYLLNAERRDYSASATMVDFSNTEAAIATLEAMIGFMREKQAMELAASGQHAALMAAQSKADYVDQFVDPTSDATLVRVFAQQLGHREHVLRSWLADRKVIYRRHAGQRFSESQQAWVDEYEWTPYAGYQTWFIIRDQPEAPRMHNGQMRTTMYVSAVGKRKIRDLLETTGGPGGPSLTI
jgi:hypothetical protein